MAIFMKRDNKNINTITAGAVGIVVGAAGTAAAYAMSNPKTRKMVTDRFNDVKEKASDSIKYIMGKSKEMRERAKKMNK